jgi:hypothetical protein
MVKKYIRSGASSYSLLLSRVEKFVSIRIRQLLPGSELNLKTSYPEVFMVFRCPTRNTLKWYFNLYIQIAF